MSAHMTGAPLELEYNGETFLFYPLRDKDYGEFEMWAQDRYLETAKRNTADMPPEERQLILMNAFDRAALITFASKEAKILMRSVEGAARIIYLSLRKAVPLDKVRNMATDPAFITTVFSKIAMLTSPGYAPASDGTKKKFTTVKKSTKSSRKGMGGRRNKSQS